MRAAPRPARPTLAVALSVGVLLVALLAGWWAKARCLDGGSWERGAQYLQWCYTDIFPLYFTEGFDRGAVPYLDAAVEYPVLTGLQQLLASVLADGGAAFFHWTAAMGAVAFVAALAVLAAQHVPGRYLLVFAGAPTMAAAAFVNWDAVPVLLLVVAVALHRRGRDGWAGVAAGLGAAAKLFPAFLVPLVLLARWRQGRSRDALAHAGGALGAVVVVNVPVALVAPEGWREFFVLNSTRPADWDSLWFLLERAGGTALGVSALNAASALAFVLAAATIVVVGARRRPPERWWELLLPVLAAFLLTSKVWSPQFSLWLLPLLALVLRRPTPLVAFLVADLWVFTTRFPFLGGEVGFSPAPGYGVFAIAVLVRAAALCWVAAAATLQREDPLALAPLDTRRTAQPPAAASSATAPP